MINISLHLVEPRIFALDKDSFRKGMKLLDKYQVSRTDFEEFGCRIGLPERVVKRELDAFAKENQMIKVLIEHSFLSDILKHQYWLSMDYRRKMLVWGFQKTVFTHQGVSLTQHTGNSMYSP